MFCFVFSILKPAESFHLLSNSLMDQYMHVWMSKSTLEFANEKKVDTEII